MKFDENRVVVDPPKKPKKMTGTRLAGVLGLDKWKTEFEVWCDITRTYSEPFIDNKYTIAGKVIEPKVIEYLKNTYLLDITTPEDIYGPNPFKVTWGDFFKDNKIFGGMWDSLLVEDGQTVGVIEIKTSSRPQDWEHDIPENYAIQASLYAYLLGVDKVIFACSFLNDKDYENPELFIPSAENTILREFKVSERYDDFGRHIEQATKWWKNHIETGISPDFNIDNKKDKDIVAELKTNRIESSEELKDVLNRAVELQKGINLIKDTFKEDEKELKKLKDIIKDYGISKFGKDDETVSIQNDKCEWNISKSTSVDIDKSKLEEDGLLEKYSTTKETYRLTMKFKEDIK